MSTKTFSDKTIFAYLCNVGEVVKIPKLNILLIIDKIRKEDIRVIFFNNGGHSYIKKTRLVHPKLYKTTP